MFRGEHSRIVAASCALVLQRVAALALVLQVLAFPQGAGAQQLTEAASPVELVNTLRGSDSSPEYSRGSTFPAVAMPFGFNLWTPVTRPDAANSLYRYEDTAIQGFSASHEPSAALGDYASFQILPSVGEVVWRAGKRGSTFSHAREVAKPHYYRVDLASGIRVEITPTLHAAALRITYPARAPRNLLFDVLDKASGGMQADVARGSVSGEVSDRGPKLYFYAKVDAPLEHAVSAPDGRASVAVSFSKHAPRTVTLRVGTSYLSGEQARVHVEQEAADLSFDALKEQARARWDSLLNRVAVEGASNSQKVTFYSNLYRALLYPSTLTEHENGADKHFSPFSNSVRPGVSYVNNGFADTFRAAWPLYFLLIPEQAGTMLEGVLNAYRAGGWLPRASAPGYREGQVGTHAAVLFADAYAKGIRNFDLHAAYAAVLKDALVVPSRVGLGRAGLARGAFRSYIPHEDVPGSAAWHFEDCIDDFSISQLARALGDHAHAEYFRLRSLNYGTLYASQTGFFRGRRADGNPRSAEGKFRPEEWGYEFAAGNAYHYTAPAMHDPGGVASLYGGAKAFAAKLDAVLGAPTGFRPGSFKQEIHEMSEARAGGLGQYAHHSAAMQHLLYMYDYVGQPWQTQKYVRKVLSESSPFYSAGAAGGGYLGEEDTGQLSAWYVLSALGFYPARVGQATYAIGSPLFARSKIALENGKSFEVVAHDNSDMNVYIQRAILNGQPRETPYLTHAEVLQGGTLELYMGDKPSLWGSAAIAAPELVGSDMLKEGVLSDCAQGGTARASLDNAEWGEVAGAAFDDDSRTKWLAKDAAAWLSYKVPSACAARFYTLTSADDEPARDPKEWTLEGSNDGDTWVALDQRHNEDFGFRHQTRVFELPKPAAYQSYRLRVTANHGDPKLQLAELELLRVRSDRTPPPAAAAPSLHQDSLWCRLLKRCSCSVVAPGSAGGFSWVPWLLLALAFCRRKRH
jgi:predicted alpha-1,2-mannosidase